MAKMIDPIPEYQGEADTWESLSNNLPKQYVVYNTRSVNTWEFDFCVLAPSQGLFILEVKGWTPDFILNVLNGSQILLNEKDNAEIVGSPRDQARGYCFDLVKVFKKSYGFNPLVMDMVCYPYISRDEFFQKRLDVVSSETETLFKEDLQDKTALLNKLNARFAIADTIKHDLLDEKLYARIRHYFEPTYDLKQDLPILNPGYSRVRIIPDDLSDDQADAIVDEYFTGIKELVFTGSKQVLISLVDRIETGYSDRNIHSEKGTIVFGRQETQKQYDEHFSTFNFDVFYVMDLKTFSTHEIVIEEGKTTEEEARILQSIAETTEFNYQQFLIEHADAEKNIRVSAGAGTGKTYSMVSRVAYLCNRAIDPVVNISDDILMITFTNDAADNMKVRLKKMFMNYFLLTSNQKYLRYIEDTSQMQVSTIHKFAITILRKTCFYLGLGKDFRVRSETYERTRIYREVLNDYLSRKIASDPTFQTRLPVPTYDLLDSLLGFSEQLYNKSIDIKSLSAEDYGGVDVQFSYFEELIKEVIIPAEELYFSFLIESNSVDLKQCMILLDHQVKNHIIRKQDFGFKYVFIDEFQDTDDSQIESVQGLYHLLEGNCKLFVVGDLKQSIYRFRGATLSAFDKVQADLHEWEEYELNTNYRSDSRMLHQFDWVFTGMGEAGYLPYNRNKDSLVSHIQKEYSSEELFKCVPVDSSDKKQFYDDVFSELSRQIDMLAKLSKQKKLSAEEKTIAILVRKNREAAQIVSQGKARGFHVITSEGGDLYRQQSTQDLFKLVQALSLPTDVNSLLSLLKSNYVNIKLDYIALAGLNEEEKLTAIKGILDEYFQIIMKKDWNGIIASFQSEPVLIVLREIYEAAQPWKKYSRDDTSRIHYMQNYECMLENIIQQHAGEYLTLNMVFKTLEINITTYQDKESRDISHDNDEIRVVCMTVHKSKGLEYGTVMLPYTAEQINKFKSGSITTSLDHGKLGYSVALGKVQIQNGYFNENIETRETAYEESRILYVAMTRAIRNFVWFKDAKNQKPVCWGGLLEVEV